MYKLKQGDFDKFLALKFELIPVHPISLEVGEQYLIRKKMDNIEHDIGIFICKDKTDDLKYYFRYSDRHDYHDDRTAFQYDCLSYRKKVTKQFKFYLMKER